MVYYIRVKEREQPTMSNQYQIFFGRNIPNNEQTVDFDTFKSFLKESVDPIFNCYTLTQAYGVWNGEFEETFIITIMTDDITVKNEVEYISQQYKEKYCQESVLYTVTEIEMNLV